MALHSRKHKSYSKVNVILTFNAEATKKKINLNLSPSSPRGTAKAKPKATTPSSPSHTVLKEASAAGVSDEVQVKSKVRDKETNVKLKQRDKQQQQNITSSVLLALADKRAERKSRIIDEGSANSAERLKVKLNILEEEMSELKEREEQLERRLRGFSTMKYDLASAIDGIHAKIEGLARKHKDIAERESN